MLRVDTRNNAELTRTVAERNALFAFLLPHSSAYVPHFFRVSYETQCSTTGQALSRSYGRFFAEFLEKNSLVRLSLLDSTTCVGFRYGFFFVMLRSFSR